MYSERTQRKIDHLEKRIVAIKQQKEDAVKGLEQLIERIRCAECPIKPGDMIVWTKNSRVYRGQVVSVHSDSYRGTYQYRAQIVSMTGRILGIGKVTEDMCPVKEERRSSRSPKRPIARGKKAT